MKNVERSRPRSNTGEPVHLSRQECRYRFQIRRNVESSNDPYLESEQLPENSVCTECGDVYMSGRWYNRQQLPTKPEHGPSGEPQPATCPACRRSRDKLPGGVLKLSGTFLNEHKDEILNLIRNETTKAQAVNPLERVMSMEHTAASMEITTTNEKLAQRIGKALYKAYDGHVEYKWSEDTKLARVNWHREV